jgi:hypothetical protein
VLFPASFGFRNFACGEDDHDVEFRAGQSPVQGSGPSVPGVPRAALSLSLCRAAYPIRQFTGITLIVQIDIHAPTLYTRYVIDVETVGMRCRTLIKDLSLRAIRRGIRRSQNNSADATLTDSSSPSYEESALQYPKIPARRGR